MPQRLSTEYVQVKITGPDAGILVTANVEMAITDATTTPVAWHVCDGYTPSTGIAKLLVGPNAGTIDWPPGPVVYVYLRITDTPERPVLTAGSLLVQDGV